MQREADDDAVHGGLAAGLAVPLKGAVGEMDLDAPLEQIRPQDADLFALGDGVGGDKGAS